ncbi:MAG TPA: hypothetical protein VIN08_04750 [Ohtaekwangia sp.]|uniref:hypothetical protein n=1 Tax=Ohtaekwangia sp. TaxID=2066019 RepID=UPI002F940EEF
MRHLIRLSWLLCAVMLVHSCTEEENQSSVTGTVQFAFDPGKAIAPHGRVASDFPAGSYLIVSIADQSGRAILTRETINLVQAGNGYISDPIVLKSGNYNLTDFWVVGPGRVMLYAAPKAQSNFASLVDRPLPFAFHVSGNTLVQEAVQVVDVHESNPEDFGYVSFPVDVVRKFAVSVFIPDDNSGLTLTNAQAFIVDDSDTIHIHDLEAKTNTIPFEENPDDTLQLVIGKDGYSRYAKIFTYNQLKDELDGSPLVVVLKPALTFVADVPGWIDPPSPYVFDLNQTTGSFTIDWGDGSIELVTEWGHQLHTYTKSGRYFVSVTGDLKNIVDQRFFYDDARFTRVDLRHLTGMVYFGAGYMGVSPSVFDFSHNTKLEYIWLGALPLWEETIFPAGLKLQGLEIDGPNRLTTEDVDAAIDVLYQSVTHYGTQSGYFSYINVVTNEVVGPPSPGGYAKLATLRDEYYWQIFPGF